MFSCATSWVFSRSRAKDRPGVTHARAPQASVLAREASERVLGRGGGGNPPQGPFWSNFTSPFSSVMLFFWILVLLLLARTVWPFCSLCEVVCSPADAREGFDLPNYPCLVFASVFRPTCHKLLLSTLKKHEGSCH